MAAGLGTWRNRSAGERIHQECAQGGCDRGPDHLCVYFLPVCNAVGPSVMMPELSAAFGLSAMGTASVVGLFYYSYSPFSLVAGVALDRVGPRAVYLSVVQSVRRSGFSPPPAPNRDVAVSLREPVVHSRSLALPISREELPASRAATLIRRDADVRHGGWLCGPIRVGRSLPRVCRGGALDLHGLLGYRAQSRALFTVLREPRQSRTTATGRRGSSGARDRVPHPQTILCGIIAGSCLCDNCLRHDLGMCVTCRRRMGWSTAMR